MVSWSTSTLDWFDKPGPSHFLSWCSVKLISGITSSFRSTKMSLNPKYYNFLIVLVETTRD